MSSGNQLGPVAGWMFERLVGNGIITDLVGVHPVKGVWQVYEEVVYEDAPFPYCLIQFYGGDQIRGNEGETVLSRQNYLVRFWAEGYDFEVMQDACDQLDITLCKSQADGTNDSVVAGCSIVRLLKGFDPVEGASRIFMGAQVEIVAYP